LHKKKRKKAGDFNSKFFIFVYYTGHGILKNTSRACLYDDENYPLEVIMRNFNNDHADNCYMFGVFDACRIAQDDAIVRNIGSGNQSDSDSDDLPEI